MTNLSVSVENLCTIIWTWNPPEGANPNCSLWYFSHFGNEQDKVSFVQRIDEIKEILWTGAKNKSNSNLTLKWEFGGLCSDVNW